MYSADAAKWTFENSNLIVSFYPTLNSICRLCPSALSQRSLASEYSPPSPPPSSHFPISPNHPQLADKTALLSWLANTQPSSSPMSSSYIVILSRHYSVITRLWGTNWFKVIFRFFIPLLISITIYGLIWHLGWGVQIIRRETILFKTHY